MYLRDLLGFTVPGGAEKLLGCGLLGGDQCPNFFPSSQIDSKLRFLNVVLQLYFIFSPESTKRVKIRIFECYARLQLPNFYQFMKELENWDFQMLADKLHLEIFPNSLKR